MSRFNAMIGLPGENYSVNGSIYQAAGSGLITGGVYQGNPSGINTTGVPSAGAAFTGINDADIQGLVAAGAFPATQRARLLNLGVVAAASPTVYVASVALSNGPLTIAAQPDVPRQGQFVVHPGAAITAGILTLAYRDSNGQSYTDVLSLVTAGSTVFTLATTRGVQFFNTAVVSLLAGGSSPNIQGGSNGIAALPADVGCTNIALTYAAMDGAGLATIPAQSATDGHLVTLGTAPDGTHTYQLGYTFYSI